MKRRTVKSAVAMALAVALLAGCGGGAAKTDASAPVPAAEEKKDAEPEKVEEPAPTEELVNKAEAKTGEPIRGGEFVTSGYFDAPPAVNGNNFAPSGWGSGKDFSFERLFDYSAVPEPYYMPRLALSFTQEGNTVTVKLDPNRKWSDGEPITPEDIVCTYYMMILNNERVWNYLEEATPQGKDTVVFKFRKESPILPIMLFNRVVDCRVKEYGKWADQIAAAVPKRTFDEEKAEFVMTDEVGAVIDSVREDCFKWLPDVTQCAVNSGYKPTKVTASEMILSRNDNYWDVNNLWFDTVKYMNYTTIEAYLANVMNRTYTAEPHGMSPDVFEQVKAAVPDMQLLWTADLGQPAYEYNLKAYPLNIPEVRQAITFAIDRDILLSIAEPGTMMYDEYNTGLTPLWRDKYADADFKAGLTDYKFNPEEGHKRLESLGWKKGSDGFYVNEKGEPVEIEVAAMNSWPIYFVTGEAMTNMLNEFGLKTKFSAMELAAYWQYIDNGKHQIAADFVGGTRYVGPWEAYRDLFYLKQRRTGFITPDDDKNMHIIYKHPDGTEVDATNSLNKLFYASEDETAAIARDLMKLNNGQCFFLPIGEKYAPLKIFNPKLSGYPTDSKDPLLYGYGEIVFARLLTKGKLYLTN